MNGEIAHKAALTVVGVVIGWAGTALTLTGRVNAIEQSLLRIETRLDNQAHATTAPTKEKS